MMNSYPLFLFLFPLLLSYFNCAANANASNIGNQNKSIQCISKERESLLQFKQGIQIDPCGLLSSWAGQECCQWHGIHCSNHSGHVIGLDLNGSYNFFCRLKGTLSPLLVELKHLKYLDLSFNSFQGEIPHQLANLSNLISLNLSFNGGLYVNNLGWLSHLTLLTDIQLSDVYLRNAIDWMHVVTNLLFLNSLQMNGCNLSPSIPTSLVYTNSSTTLRVLSLRANLLNDTSIFQWVFNFNSSLVYLDLSENEISGIIPSSLGNMHSLSHLYLHVNRFEGPIPETISNLKHLEHLDLSWNNFQGKDLNPNIFRSLCGLHILGFSDNNLTIELSTIIKTLSQCAHKSLVYLYLSNNSLWGSIPDEIGAFSSLQGLFLSSNQLNGTISPHLGQLSMLETFDLSSNSLKGTLLDHHLSNLSRLSALWLFDNPELVVNIGDNWVPPFQLAIIRLSSCKLGPSFPKWLLTQMKFSLLEISNTGISDSIPISFWNSLPSHMVELDMSNNAIHGILPNLSVSFNDFPRIDLSSNSFHGAVPSFLRNASVLLLHHNQFSGISPFFCPEMNLVLGLLDLSNNLLSGEIPSCWGHFDRLTVLQLDDNNFFGNLPASIGVLMQLQALHLRNNSISGELPLSFKNLSSLVLLDLSYNSLTGQIPHWIGNPTNSTLLTPLDLPWEPSIDYDSTLVILSLRSNNFVGDLPSSLCRLSSLQILDLSANRLSGPIPHCIYKLTAMIHSPRTMTVDIPVGMYTGAWASYDESEVIMWKRKEWSFKGFLGEIKAIDISDNKLQGPIPDTISDLTGLVFLNLSGNRLNGTIPPKIGQLTSLEFLDLSDNQISGEIPRSLSNVSSLEILDLSYNNLSGRIPLGTQLQSFDASSYIGNPNLCGDPLRKCPGDHQPPTNTPPEDNSTLKDEEEDDDGIFPGLYISVVLGFIVGFWGVCGTLVIKRSWRIAYFRFVEVMTDKLYVMVVMNMPKVWRNT